MGESGDIKIGVANGIKLNVESLLDIFMYFANRRAHQRTSGIEYDTTFVSSFVFFAQR